MHHNITLPDVLKIADTASEKVLSIYMTDFKVNYKADESPITAADVPSHRVIVEGLRNLSHDIPVLSEEGAAIPWSEREHWRRFWLIDPIDGTRDFTQRTGEFTVNIALIEDGEPILGLVTTAPALKEAYWGLKGEGAYKRDRTGQVRRISVAVPGETKRVVASKNHLNDETKAFIDKLGVHVLVQAGSSLKFCKIAEGHADIYPRLGPTCEWDTGAAHAVLAAAGGKVETLDGSPLRYGKEDVLNPFFVASGAWYRQNALGQRRKA
jgi:3'(2'), 5'-bisphosphate nucleotidase